MEWLFWSIMDQYFWSAVGLLAAYCAGWWLLMVLLRVGDAVSVSMGHPMNYPTLRQLRRWAYFVAIVPAAALWFWIQGSWR
jgi:hypothetical protein